jgi:hypothetical protein
LRCQSDAEVNRLNVLILRVIIYNLWLNRQYGERERKREGVCVLERGEDCDRETER